MTTACEVRRINDLVYSTAGGVELLADVYLPVANPPFPVVLCCMAADGVSATAGSRRI